MIWQRIFSHTQRVVHARLPRTSTCYPTLQHLPRRTFTSSRSSSWLSSIRVDKGDQRREKQQKDDEHTNNNESTEDTTKAHQSSMRAGIIVLAVLSDGDQRKHVFERLKAGETVRMDDPEWYRISEVVSRTRKLSAALNSSTDIDQIRELISEITGCDIHQSSAVFAPFYTNFGANIRIGCNVFINHDCTFLDLGGITIEDDVLIGPKVSLITENHPLAPSERRALVCSPIVIQRNAWIGAGATILPGVTVGENSIVAAGAVVSKDVPPNTIVAGVPAKIIKTIS